MYIQVYGGNLVACADYPFIGHTSEVNVDYEDYIGNPDKYVWNGSELALNEDYEKEQEKKEKERIARLNMTKLDFSNCLIELGVSYTQLKELLATNEEAQRQWDLCERVYRFNPMLEQLASVFGITPEQLDMMFKKANGEL